MSAGQSQRIKELRAKLTKAEQYTYVWYTIACELAGKDAVDAAFQRVLTEGMAVDRHDPMAAAEIPVEAEIVPADPFLMRSLAVVP